MTFGFDFLPVMQVIGTFTLASLVIYFANTKRDFNWTWMVLVILPIYLAVAEIHKGEFGDIFFNLPWTLETTVIASILVFFLLGFKFPIKDHALILLIIAFFFLLGTGGSFWANMIGIVFYSLFSILFIKSGITTLKHWFSDAP